MCLAPGWKYVFNKSFSMLIRFFIALLKICIQIKQFWAINARLTTYESELPFHGPFRLEFLLLLVERLLSEAERLEFHCFFICFCWIMVREKRESRAKITNAHNELIDGLFWQTHAAEHFTNLNCILIFRGGIVSVGISANGKYRRLRNTKAHTFWLFWRIFCASGWKC